MLVEGKVPVQSFENVRAYAKRRLKADHGSFKRSFSRLSEIGRSDFHHRDGENAKLPQEQTSHLLVIR
jgi:hypothetical protein